MKNLIKRVVRALEDSNRYLNEFLPRPLPSGAMRLRGEIDAILEELAKFPPTDNRDVEALEFAMRQAPITHAKQMQAARAFRVVQIFNGQYRRHNENS
jgi:hypothetical protein